MGFRPYLLGDAGVISCTHLQILQFCFHSLVNYQHFFNSYYMPSCQYSVLKIENNNNNDKLPEWNSGQGISPLVLPLLGLEREVGLFVYMGNVFLPLSSANEKIEHQKC